MFSFPGMVTAHVMPSDLLPNVAWSEDDPSSVKIVSVKFLKTQIHEIVRFINLVPYCFSVLHVCQELQPVNAAMISKWHQQLVT